MAVATRDGATQGRHGDVVHVVLMVPASSACAAGLLGCVAFGCEAQTVV